MRRVFAEDTTSLATAAIFAELAHAFLQWVADPGMTTIRVRRGTTGLSMSQRDYFQDFHQMWPCFFLFRALKVRSALDKADRTQIAVKARREAVSLSGAIPDSMLPECQGEDYPALKTARRAAMKGWFLKECCLCRVVK